MCISKAHLPISKCFYIRAERIVWTLGLDLVLALQKTDLRTRYLG